MNFLISFREDFSKTERDILAFYLIATDKIAKAKGRDIWQDFVANDVSYKNVYHFI